MYEASRREDVFYYQFCSVVLFDCLDSNASLPHLPSVWCSLDRCFFFERSRSNVPSPMFSLSLLSLFNRLLWTSFALVSFRSVACFLLLLFHCFCPALLMTIFDYCFCLLASTLSHICTISIVFLLFRSTCLLLFPSISP